MCLWFVMGFDVCTGSVLTQNNLMTSPLTMNLCCAILGIGCPVYYYSSHMSCDTRTVTDGSPVLMMRIKTGTVLSFDQNRLFHWLKKQIFQRKSVQQNYFYITYVRCVKNCEYLYVQNFEHLYIYSLPILCTPFKQISAIWHLAQCLIC